MSEFPAEESKRREERCDGSYIEWRWDEWVIHFDSRQNAHDEWNKLAANEGAANVSRVTSRDVPTCLEASNKKQRVEQMSCEDAWKTHVSLIRPEIRTPRASVKIQLGESDNSFQGADALVDEIRRKGDAVHIVLRYKGEDVIARFNTSRMGMPLIATVSCYAARAIPSRDKQQRASWRRSLSGRLQPMSLI